MAPAPESRNHILGRLGHACARHKWWVLAAWVVALVGLVAMGRGLGGSTNNALSVPGLAASDGATIMQQAFPQQGAASGQAVVQGPKGTDLTAGAPAAAIARAVAQIKAVPGVLAVVPPGAPGTVSPGHETAIINIEWSTPPDDLGQANLDRVKAAADPLHAAGLQVAYAGAPATEAEAQGTDWSALVGVLAAVVILLLAFGSVVFMAIPVVGALVAVGTALAVLAVLESVMSVSQVGLTLAVMIGLGVSVDYALFVSTRHAQGMRDGLDVDESIGRATATAGRAVVIAGGTVAIAVLGLAAAQIPFVTQLGYAAAIAVVVAVLAAITLLPAGLAIAGHGLEKWRIPFISPPGPVRLEGDDGRPRGWARWSLSVTRRPWPHLLVGLVIIVGLALPIFWMQLGQVDSGSDPPGSTTRAAYDMIATGFGPGFNGPVDVVLKGPGATSGAAAVAAAAAKVPGVAAVTPPVSSATQPVAMFTVIPGSAPASDATADLVRSVSSVLGPATPPGTAVYATGLTAIGVDLADRVSAALPWFIAAVILISFVLLAIEFKSLLVPLQAAVMNLLSVGAAFGVVVAIFEWGFLRPQIGVPEAVAIEAWVPMMMFAILFGLSMDYEVFLLSRVREGWIETGDPHRSVAIGVAGTARVISAAALIMVSVFLAFVLNDNVVVKMLGVGLAAAVLIDATVVRLLLVPAVLALVGKWNWWLPHWLAWLLRAGREEPSG